MGSSYVIIYWFNKPYYIKFCIVFKFNISLLNFYTTFGKIYFYFKISRINSNIPIEVVINDLR